MSPYLRVRLSVRFALTYIAVAFCSFSLHSQSVTTAPTRPHDLHPPIAVDHEQIIPYWSTESSWQSEIQVRNNLLKGDLTVTPVLRAADRTEMVLTPVVIKPQEIKIVDVGAAVTGVAPQYIGTYGSVALRYHSPSTANLFAMLMLHDIGHSIAFHIDASSEDQDPRAGSREGIWWLPNETASEQLILTNQGSAALPIRVSLYDSTGRESKQEVTLPPRATNRLSIRQLVTAAGLAGNYGGIKISAAAHAGSLDSVHVVFDEEASLSAILKMFDHNPVATLAERDYAKTQVWTLRAPMLALSKPDPALAFPEGTVLQPQIFIRNTMAKPVQVTMRFNWRSLGATGKATGPSFTLAANETRRIDIAALQSAKVLPLDANWTSVILTTNGLPDEVMAVAASYDSTLRYGAQTPFSDQLAFHWEGSLWEYDAQHNSLITAGNGGTKPIQAAFTIYYSQGTQNYQLEQALQPGEQMWIDVGKLIREKVPDKNGNILPADLSFGSYELRDRTNKGVGTLFEGKVVYDKTYGHVTYGCAACCGYVTVSPWYNPLWIPLGFTAPNGVNAYNTCDSNNEDVSDAFYGHWSTANQGIATVNYDGTFTGVAIGATTSTATGNLQSAHRPLCPVLNYRCSGNDNTISIRQSPGALNMSSGDAGKGITVSVSPSTVASSVVIAQGATTNPNSSSLASFTYNKPSSFTGNDLWQISIGGTSSPSGIQNSQACVYGVCSSQLSDVAVPPQILIQMIQAEAGGTNSTTMTAVGEVARNRFTSTIFNPPYSTYQNEIPGQFATTSTPNGIEPELDIAASIFTGGSAGNFCGSLSFWTPTSSQWSVVQAALSSGTTTFPSGTGAPTYDSSKWPTSAQQILFVPAVGTNSSGVPYFLFLAQRSSTQPAAANASCY